MITQEILPLTSYNPCMSTPIMKLKWHLSKPLLPSRLRGTHLMHNLVQQSYILCGIRGPHNSATHPMHITYNKHKTESTEVNKPLCFVMVISQHEPLTPHLEPNKEIIFAITNQNVVVYKKVLGYSGHQDDTWYIDIKLCVWINDTITCSVVKTIEKACVIVQRVRGIFTFTCFDFCFSTPNLKLDMTIFMIHNC